MESFQHKNKEIEFWSVTGEVLSQNKYSETHISSSGGGGYVGKYGGHVSAPKIHSTTVTNHEFWIKKEDGSEKGIQLAGHDIPLREGQKITLIAARVKGKDSSCYSILVNHTANKHWFINKAVSLNKHLNIYLTPGKLILIAGGLSWLIAYLTDSVETGTVVAGVFTIYLLAIKIPNIFKMTKSLDRHLEFLAQQVYKNA